MVRAVQGLPSTVLTLRCATFLRASLAQPTTVVTLRTQFKGSNLKVGHGLIGDRDASHGRLGAKGHVGHVGHEWYCCLQIRI